MNTTPKDPGAIDLEVIRSRSAPTPQTSGAYDINRLIAAVEALRERVAELERERDLAVAHDTQPYPTAAAYDVVCKARAIWQRRANTADARVVELAGALEKIGQSGPVDMDGNDDAYAGWSWCYDTANTALASALNKEK